MGTRYGGAARLPAARGHGLGVNRGGPRPAGVHRAHELARGTAQGQAGHVAAGDFALCSRRAERQGPNSPHRYVQRPSVLGPFGGTYRFSSKALLSRRSEASPRQEVYPPPPHRRQRLSLQPGERKRRRSDRSTRPHASAWKKQAALSGQASALFPMAFPANTESPVRWVAELGSPAITG